MVPVTLYHRIGFQGHHGMGASVDRMTDTTENITFPCTTYAGPKKGCRTRVIFHIVELNWSNNDLIEK